MRHIRSTHLGEHGSKLCFQLLHFRQSLNEEAWGGEEPNGVSSRSGVKDNHREVKMMDNPEKGSAIQDSIELLSCWLQHIHEQLARVSACTHSTPVSPQSLLLRQSQEWNLKTQRGVLWLFQTVPLVGKGGREKGDGREERGDGEGERDREREERGGEEKKQ